MTQSFWSYLSEYTSCDTVPVLLFCSECDCSGNWGLCRCAV